ncbi:MAG TPA: hypothetical protein DCF68_04365 [Cyanothece sp. UBA12306]|nr:hypothetical protein [Cyanothece sp. UBA12306]
MNKNWQRLLKKKLIKQYIDQENREWIDLNFSTSGNLNLTVVSDKFLELTREQRKKEILDFIDDQNQENVSNISTGFLSLYTIEEANSLDLSPLPTGQNTINTFGCSLSPTYCFS